MRRRRLAAARRGVTLLELLVVLVILGLVASLVAFAPSAVERAPVDDVGASIAEARREALRTGVSVTIEILIEGAKRSVTAMPDGSVIADPSLDVNRLSGRGSARGAM